MSAAFYIFFKTKEIYDLSNHRGIKYFRLTFLFFSLAFLMKLVMRSTRLIDFHFVTKGTIVEFMIIITLLEALALVFLFSSVFWRKVRSRELAFAIVGLLGLFILCLLFVSYQLFLVLNGFLLLASIGLVLFKLFRGRKKKKIAKLYVLYLGIIGFLVATNIVDYFLDFTFWTGWLYSTMTILFIYLVFRVVKKIG
tara:strand:+ start:896 stop:1483 length:588 start_codon:yes stop_codon:yes gene_type:complete